MISKDLLYLLKKYGYFWWNNFKSGKQDVINLNFFRQTNASLSNSEQNSGQCQKWSLVQKFESRWVCYGSPEKAMGNNVKI